MVPNGSGAGQAAAAGYTQSVADLQWFHKILNQLQSGRGYIDDVGSFHVTGWAVDRSRPGEPVVVEAMCGERRVATALADVYRPDLEQAGIGSGRHGFSLKLPPEVVFTDDPAITVRIRDSRVNLPWQGNIRIPIKGEPIRFVASDIVNNCNLRCPFCVVDYSAVTSTELMSEGTFRRLLRLLPMIPEAGFWLSCLHEPTLHPRLNDFIDLIPRADRNKFFFTTNLAKPIKERVFEQWAESGLHHINISFDTLDAELFSVLRKFGKFEVFRENVERMATIFRKHPEAPKIRYISMVFRSNMAEIPEIVTQTHERYHAHESELRYTYNMEHITDGFRSEQYLRKDEWPALAERLKSLPYNYQLVCPPEDQVEEFVNVSANYFDIPRPHYVPRAPEFVPPFELRARPNGTLMMVGQEKSFSVNINSLEDPVTYFTELARTGILPPEQTRNDPQHQPSI